MQSRVMNHCRIGSENRRLYRWMPCIGKTPTEGNLNDVFEVEIMCIGCQRVGKAIERLLQLGFKIFENRYNFLNSRLVDHTARSKDEQTDFFVKLDVWRQFHHSPRLSHKPALGARKDSKEPITGGFIWLVFPGYCPCTVNFLGHDSKEKCRREPAHQNAG